MKHRSLFAALLPVGSAMVLLSVSPATSAQTGGMAPVVSITATDPVAVENSDNTGMLTFARVGDSTGGLYVHFEVKGTARDGVDYESIASGRPFPTDPAEQRLLGYVRFEPGSTSVQVKIVPLNDTASEGTETVVVRVLPPLTASPIDGYQVGEPAEEVVEIEDDEPAPNQPPIVRLLSPSEGAQFTAPASLVITALARDEDGRVDKVEFFAGDRLIGTDETAPFGLTWEQVPAGEYVLTAKATDDDGASSSSGGTRILVEAPSPEPATVNVEATDPEAAEISPLLDVMPDTAVFTVTRSGGTNIALPVYYEVGGTAQKGTDYEKLSGTVIIPEGAWSATIVVNAIDDPIIEGPESVVVELSWPACPAIYPPPPECYQVGEHGRAEARILDNDEPPGNLPPMIRITQPLAGSVFRAPAAIDITALVRDLDGWVGLVQFFANERKIGEQRIDFIQAPPPGELQTFGLDWSHVPAGDYSLVAMATDNRGAVGKSAPVRIRVVETAPPPPVVTIHARDSVAREGMNPAGLKDTATLVVRRNDGTNTALTVFYSVRGTAENGVDYPFLSGSVTIPEGRRSARVVVSPIDDTLRERVETVVIKLEPDPTMGPTARYTPGRPGRTAAVILDNDVRLPRCQWLADGLFQFCQPGEDGACFRMEYSTDLRNWTSIDTGVVADGAIHFVDPEATSQSSRFYRLAPEIHLDLDE